MCYFYLYRLLLEIAKAVEAFHITETPEMQGARILKPKVFDALKRYADHEQNAYSNPSAGPVYVVSNVPEGVEQARLSVRDLNGRLVKEITLQQGAGIAEIQPGFASAGIYLAELRLDGIRAGQVKLALQ